MIDVMIVMIRENPSFLARITFNLLIKALQKIPLVTPRLLKNFFFWLSLVLDLKCLQLQRFMRLCFCKFVLQNQGFEDQALKTIDF